MVVTDLALAFANTRRDRPSGRVETLSDPVAAAAWLEHELGYTQDEPIGQLELAQLRALRDSAQRLLRSRLGDVPPDPADLRLVNRASAAAPRCDQLDERLRTSRRFVESGSTRPSDLGELSAALAGATIALAADASANLAECGADDCVVLFLRTDPRQRWHSDRCGNRMRAARSYARHRSRATPSQDA